MKSALSLEKDWLEGLHRECLPAVNTYPPEIREAISYSSQKVANPLFPFLVRWVLEPAGITQHSIIPVAYSAHLLEASSYVIDRLVGDACPRSDRRLERLVTRYGDALCILCVDAMVTTAFQLLTELPVQEFLALSELLQERFGASGVLGNKVRKQVNWRGDMVVVCLEASSLIADFEPPVGRALMQYARRTSALYRELEDLLGEPPGREVLIGRGVISVPGGFRERERARELVLELQDEARILGSRFGEFFSLSEGIGEIFGALQRSLSRLEEKQ
jgi:geranylgeranyl diphosphate synthase type II